MAVHFDFLIKEALSFLPHPNNPLQLVQEQVDIGITKGRIVKISSSLARASTDETFKARGLCVLPGLIDTQVHFREPGMIKAETIESGSRSALLGGITGFFEMPNTRPPTTNIKALKDKIKRAQGKSWCDFAFFAGAMPNNLADIKEMEKHPHCPGTKIFMGSSTGSLLVNHPQDIEKILQASTKKIAVHSEDEQRMKDRESIRLSANGDVKKHLEWRDERCALISTKKIVELAKKNNRQIHILHITSAEEIEYLTQNQKHATVEVTPQHLTLSAPECYDRLGSFAQMNPPIRDEKHQRALWKGIKTGGVTMLGSDHAPHPLLEKQKKYPHSPSGMPGVQTMLPIMLNHVHAGRLSLKRLTELLALNPCKYYKIKDQGLIRENFKANFTFVDVKKQKKIKKDWLASRCGWSPFEGMLCTGWPFAVMLKGQWAMQEDEIIGPPKGEGICFS